MLTKPHNGWTSFSLAGTTPLGKMKFILPKGIIGRSINKCNKCNCSWF